MQMISYGKKTVNGYTEQAYFNVEPQKKQACTRKYKPVFYRLSKSRSGKQRFIIPGTLLPAALRQLDHTFVNPDKSVLLQPGKYFL